MTGRAAHREKPAGGGGRPAGSAASGRGLLAADVTAGAILASFAILKAYALAPALSDENIYFYMCRRIAEGALPYRDFFFAHPPLHLLPGTLAVAIFGFSLPVAKAVPALAAALAGLAVYRAGRRGGALAGLLAAALFLFAYDMLRASSHYTGASEATALIAWAMERALAGRPRTAGLLAAAAGMTAFYAVPAGVAIGTWILLRGGGGWGAAKGYALSWAALFGALNLLCAFLFGSGYWDPVFRYHFMKPPGGEGSLGAVLGAIARENPWLVWSGPAAIAAFAATRAMSTVRARGAAWHTRIARALAEPLWGPALAGVMIAALHLAFFSMLGKVFTFYILPAFPGLALAGGAAYTAAIGWAIAARSSRRPARGAAAAPSPGILTALALAVFVVGGPLVLPAIFPLQGISTEEGERLRSYAWRDSPLPGPLDGAVKALLWRDDRVAGAWTLAATRYLWHESRHFTAPGMLADRLRGRLPAGSTVWGDSSAAPLVALLLDTRVARDHADTNSMRYRSGITPPERAIGDLESDLPAAIIANPRRGFFLVPQMQRWVTARYSVADTFRDPIYGTYDLYLPRQGGGRSGRGLPGPPVEHHTPTEDHDPHARESAEVDGRVTFDRDQIGAPPGLDRAAVGQRWVGPGGSRSRRRDQLGG